MTAPKLTGVTSPATFLENSVNAAPQLLDTRVTSPIPTTLQRRRRQVELA